MVIAVQNRSSWKRQVAPTRKKIGWIQPDQQSERTRTIGVKTLQIFSKKTRKEQPKPLSRDSKPWVVQSALKAHDPTNTHGENFLKNASENIFEFSD